MKKTSSLILLLVAVVSLSCSSPLLAQAAQSVESAIIPVPREGRHHDRYLMLNERAQSHQGELDLLFVGDSITQGWEGAGKEFWERFYGHRRAVNIGIGGDRTQHVLWRLENGNIEGLSPKVTVVMIGTNNSGLNRNSTPEVLEGVTAVVHRIREKLPETKILLLAIFPRGREFNEQRGRILQVNQALRKLEDGERIHFLDIGHIFLQPDGSLSEEIMPDALHLSPAGYQLWAEAMEPTLQKLLEESR
jgi:lysophospholipase L1-like esterase